MKILRIVRSIFAFLGLAAPFMDEAKALFPHVKQIAVLDEKLDRLLASRSKLDTLRAEVDQALLLNQPPDVKALLERIRLGLAALA